MGTRQRDWGRGREPHLAGVHVPQREDRALSRLSVEGRSARSRRIVGIVLAARLRELRAVLVDELDGHRSFAHGRRDALHRAVANVARREHARDTGLEWQWIALERP